MIDLIFEDFKVREHLDQNIWRLIENLDEQPTMRNVFDTNIGFHKIIHTWFEDNNIKYKLSWRPNKTTVISFETISDLIMFKLTWC
jgi:hypothetical protein